MKINPNKLRKLVLDMVYSKQSGHIGGSFSIAELIAYLYSNYDLLGDDKLILSKGHAVPVIYAALHELDILTTEELNTFREVDSRLQGHPDKLRIPEVISTTGSLGQGLSIAIGHALGSKLKNIDNTVFCICGDGEVQEGQIWEGLMSAPKFNLGNLVCIIDCNGSQNDGYVEDIMNLDNLENRIKEFGWNTLSINGHDFDEIEKSMNSLMEDIPTCIILNTQKGKGISFMETFEWHSKAPNEEEYKKALKELGYESNS